MLLYIYNVISSVILFLLSSRFSTYHMKGIAPLSSHWWSSFKSFTWIRL